MQRWSDIKEKIDGQLENMGFDPAMKKKQVEMWKDCIATPFLVVGHGLKKMVGLIQKLGETIQGKDKVTFKNFITNIKIGFADYLTTSMNASDNQINIQLQRQDQLINIIGT